MYSNKIQNTIEIESINDNDNQIINDNQNSLSLDNDLESELKNELDEYLHANGKLNLKLPVLLVDTSYWLYYRFFSLRTWYSKIYPETQLIENFNAEHNWLSDEIFMKKFKKLFIDNIKKLCKRFKTELSNVIFCLDCSHKDIWRCEKIKDYKGKRLESHKKKQFNSFDLFRNIKREYLPELQKKYSVNVIKCNNCEADDIIGYLTIFLSGKDVPKILILANDNDYLQVCNFKIRLINGIGKYISEYNNEPLKYLISKIIIGDVSDNIKCCSLDMGYLTNNKCNGVFKKFNKNSIIEILNNEKNYNLFKNVLDDIRNNVYEEKELANPDVYKMFQLNKFKENAIVMDFEMIPDKLKHNLLNLFNNLI